MLEKNAKIFIAGHRGLVGSAIWNNLRQRGYTNLVGRSHKELETRSHTDGFRRNNANYWNKREICRFYLYSSIIWFCPVLEELGK